MCSLRQVYMIDHPLDPQEACNAHTWRRPYYPTTRLTDPSRRWRMRLSVGGRKVGMAPAILHLFRQ